MAGARGSYHSIFSTLLDDLDFQVLSPTARLVFFYLRLHKDHGLAGIFVLYRSTLVEQSGLDPEVVDAAMAELESGGWIKTDRRIVWVVGGLAHNPGFNAGNRNHRTGLLNGLRELPRTRLFVEFRDRYKSILIAHADLEEGIGILSEYHSNSIPIVSEGHSNSVGIVSEDYQNPVSVTEAVTETEEEEHVAPTAATRAAAKAERDRKALQVWQEWQQTIRAKAVNGTAEVVDLFLPALESSIEEFYSQTGGSFTPKRKADLARQLWSCKLDALLLGIEIYVDTKHGIKDERYFRGIVRKNEQLTEAEMGGDLKRHRARMHGSGIGSEL